MKISEMLKSMASWLEDPNNEAFLLAEYDDKCLEVVASSCLSAASELRKAAEQVDSMEPVEDLINAESVEELARISEAFDNSGDEKLMKQSSVIDALLFSMASDVKEFSSRESLMKGDINPLFLKKEKPLTSDQKKIADAEKAIEESGATKNYKVLEMPLSSRSCPDHPGNQMARVGDSIYQCSLDKKVYDYEAGYDMENGKSVPGSSVSNQNILEYSPEFTMFDNREERIRSKS